MLRKTRKLNLSWEANRYFYREYRIFRGNGLTVYSQPIENLTAPRLTIVVGKKVSKLAVIRNEIKRQLYIQAEQLGLLKLNSNIVIVTLGVATQLERSATLEKFLRFFAK